MNKKIAIFTITFALIGMLSGCSGNEEVQNDPNKFVPLSSKVLLELYIDTSQVEWKLEDAQLVQLDEKATIPAAANGDHAVIVRKANGDIQYATLQSHETSSIAMAYNEITRNYEEVELPNSNIIVLRVPLDATSDSVVIEDAQGNSYPLVTGLQDLIPETIFKQYGVKSLSSKTSQTNSIPIKSLSKNLGTNVQILQAKYPHIYFGRGDDFFYFPLDNDELAKQLLIALAKLPNQEVVNAIQEISFVKDPTSPAISSSEKNIVTFGSTSSQRIILNEYYVVGGGQGFFNLVLVHEVGHAFDNFYTKEKLPQDWFDHLLVKIFPNLIFPHIDEAFQSLQNEFRQLRSQSDCGEPYVEAEYTYKKDGGLGVSEDFLHGFSTVYGSTKYSEDFAELFSYVINKPELVAPHWAEDNVYDKKIRLLLGYKMITEEIYNHIKNLAQNNNETYTMEFHYRGVQKEGLYFILNGQVIEPSFFGAGQLITFIDKQYLSMNPDENSLSLETTYESEIEDYDDIEVAEILIKRQGPVSATTGCENGETIFFAKEPIHLGDSNCDSDQYCNSYSPLQGTSYEWKF